MTLVSLVLRVALQRSAFNPKAAAIYLPVQLAYLPAFVSACRGMATLHPTTKASQGVLAMSTPIQHVKAVSKLLPSTRSSCMHNAPVHGRHYSVSSCSVSSDTRIMQAAISPSTAGTAQHSISREDAWMDRIHLNGMRFYGWHGVLLEETKLGQPFAVDAVLSFDLKRAGQTDDLSNTINYAEAYAQIKAIVEGPPQQLLEAVAETICSTLLQQHLLLQSVRLHIRKLSIPGVPAAIDSVGVEIQRSRIPA